MSEPSPDRDEEMLARLAEFDLAAAERVHGRLMAAEAASEIAELGRTYQRIARSLRQTLALKARLKADRAAAATTAPAPPKPSGVAVRRRLSEVRQAVTRVIWRETEDPDQADWLEDELHELLTREMLGDRFCAEPLDDHVARICEDFGFSQEVADRWRDLPDPDEDDPEEADADAPDDEAAVEPPDRQSSA